MSIIKMLNHIPSCFYSVFTYETNSIEITSDVYEEIFKSCCGFYHSNKDKKQIESSLKTLCINENNLYGSILFDDDDDSIRIVSFKNNKEKIINCVFITHKYILESASYSGTVEAILYTKGCTYKRKTQKEFNIYTDIDVGSYQLTKEEIENKQLILI